MSKLKELSSDTLIYGISSVIARFINYLLVPLYTDTEVFATNEYGIVVKAFVGIAFLNVVFTMGMESAYLRYAKNRDEAKDFFKTIQGFLSVTTVLLFIILWLLFPAAAPSLSLENNVSIYLMILGILAFDTLAIVPFAELRLVRKSILFAAIKTGNVLVNVGLNLYLILVLGYGIEAVFISNIIASFLTAIATFIATAKLLSGSFNKVHLRTALYFGLPFIPAGIAHVMNEGLDRFFLGSMGTETIERLYGAGLIGDDIAGVYGGCYKVGVFMLLFIQMFRMAWQPFFMRHSSEPEAPALFASVFKYYNMIAAILFITISLFVNDIVAIKIPFTESTLLGENYWFGLQIVPVILMAYWFQGMYMNFSAGIFITEQTKRLPQITIIGALITIAGNIILVPKIGMMGSAWATLCSYAVMAGLLYWYSNKVYKVPYSLIRAALVILISASVIIIKPRIVDLTQASWMANLILLFSGAALIAIINLNTSLLPRRG